jgi:signal transduction protein with GAF and PtsI domain
MSVFYGYVHEDTGKFALDPIESKKFRAFVAKKLKGQEVALEIRPRRQKRTEAQGRGFHAMVQPWAREEGHDIDELKRQLLEHVFGTHEATHAITGEVVTVPNKLHTSTLTVQEFSDLIEQTLIIAAECGVILTAPDEYRRNHPEIYGKPKRRAA